MKTLCLSVAFSALISTCALITTGCTRHSELHNAMEDMGGAFKVMRESQDISELKQKMVELKAGLEISAGQAVRPEDQATFDEGIEKVNALVAKIDAALAQNDLAAAKSAIDELGSERKRYHEKLDVK